MTFYQWDPRIAIPLEDVRGPQEDYVEKLTAFGHINECIFVGQLTFQLTLVYCSVGRAACASPRGRKTWCGISPSAYSLLFRFVQLNSRQRLIVPESYDIEN